MRSSSQRFFTGFIRDLTESQKTKARAMDGSEVKHMGASLSDTADHNRRTYGAGGATDVMGRIAAEGMRARLTQFIIIENAPGANGTTGVGRVLRMPADGYTISIGDWSTHIVNGAIYTLPYDLLKDFQPIVLLTRNPYLIVARKAMPANDLGGSIAWLKANRALAGTAGVGSPPHVGGIFSERNRHQSAVRALSWGRPVQGVEPHQRSII
jgi:tripartite-type tricarboxylate transporter receptor subunit TctC